MSDFRRGALEYNTVDYGFWVEGSTDYGTTTDFTDGTDGIGVRGSHGRMEMEERSKEAHTGGLLFSLFHLPSLLHSSSVLSVKSVVIRG